MTKRQIKWAVAAVIVLGAIGVAAYKAQEQEAGWRAMEQDAAPVLAALERYKAEKGGYPRELAALVPAYVADLPRCAELQRTMPYLLEEETKGFEIYCPTGWLMKRGYRSAVGAWATYE